MTDTTETNGDVSGLKNKNSDLIRQNKELKERAERAEREKDEAAEAAANQNSTEVEKLQKRAEKAEREAKAANERADSNAKTLRDYKASSALATAIASANVDADDVEIVTMALRSMVEDDADGEPSIKGKSIEDYTKSFFATTGRKYVRAADHNGGGASGSDGAKATTWSKLPTTGDEWAEFNQLPAEVRNPICDRLGAPQLKV